VLLIDFDPIKDTKKDVKRPRAPETTKNLALK
jgi:hypothetical protein